MKAGRAGLSDRCEQPTPPESTRSLPVPIRSPRHAARERPGPCLKGCETLGSTMFRTRPRPDFIAIGAMKCATTTLHEQLARQGSLFMSRPKEPNFFSDDRNYARGMDWYHSCFAGCEDGHLV